MNKRVELLRKQITAGTMPVSQEQEWGGAGVIFTNNPAHPSLEDKSVHTVVTPHVCQLIGMIEELKKGSFTYDYLSKYDCYGKMADAVENCALENCTAQETLLAALDAVGEYLQ